MARQTCAWAGTTGGRPRRVPLRLLLLLPSLLRVPAALPRLQMTTNCIVEPRQSYADRIFTTGEVGWAGVRHIEGEMGRTKDYSALISKAQVGAALGLRRSGRARRGAAAGCAGQCMAAECMAGRPCLLLTMRPFAPVRHAGRSCPVSSTSRPRARPSL